jgi:hypothetical protein
MIGLWPARASYFIASWHCDSAHLASFFVLLAKQHGTQCLMLLMPAGDDANFQAGNRNSPGPGGGVSR